MWKAALYCPAMQTKPVARAERAPKGYKFPRTEEALLEWEDVEQRLEAARFYWLATTNADGSPRVRPVWGVWVEGRFYFDGHPRSGWARNLVRDARMSVHLESAEHVVIVEGLGQDLERTDDVTGRKIAERWHAKYGRLVPDAAATGIFRMTPTRARGWSEDLTDGTVFTFAADEPPM